MMGVAFVVEPYIFVNDDDVATHSDDNIFTGQVIS